MPRRLLLRGRNSCAAGVRRYCARTLLWTGRLTPSRSAHAIFERFEKIGKSEEAWFKACLRTLSRRQRIAEQSLSKRAHALTLSEALSLLLSCSVSDARSLLLVLTPQGSSTMAGKDCPQGFYCEGGPLDRAPCSCEPGYYCPQLSSIGNGSICPQGHACNGGTEDAVECQSPPGKFCAEGEKQLFGKICNPGSFCTGTVPNSNAKP